LPSPETDYREITVRLWGKGAVLRGVTSRANLAGGRRFIARPGQLILSRIDARNGAIALVPDGLDGALVTNDFPLFDLDRSKLEPAYLGWASKTARFVELCQQASEGTTNRVRLQEDRFLALEIPLPPLAEQRRIVARIEELVAKIEEARTLRRLGAGEAGALLLNQAGEILRRLSERFPRREFGSFSPHVTSGPRNWAKHYEQNGYRFYRAQDIGPDGQILQDSKVFIGPPPGDQGRSAMLQPGDLMLVITGATVGRVTVYPQGLEPGFVSQHVAICRLPANEVDPEFALWGLRSPEGQGQLLGQRYGQGKPGLNLSNIRALSLPFPPIPEQRRIVAELDALQAEVDDLKLLQAETAAELDALLPSILDRAFKGEL
jgi:type I restriction enzyme S subunit